MADDSYMAENEKSPLLSGWMIVVIVAIVAIAAVGITALATHSSTSSSATTTKAPVVQTTTTLAPTTTTQQVPMVLVCSGTPEYEPATLSWCSSLCSSYMKNITWTSWTAA